MKIQTRLWTVIGIGLLVSGCAYTDSVFGGRAPRAVVGPGAPSASAEPSPASTPASPAGESGLPDLSSGVADAGPGADVTELRAAVQRLDDNLSAHQQELQRIGQKLDRDQATYTGLVAVIKADLRPGAAPDEAHLVESWSQAETALDRMTDDVAELTALSRVAAGDGQLAAQLGTQAQALSTRPPAGADASRTVAQLGNAVEAARARSDTLAETLKSDISQKSAFVSTQRGSLGEALLAIRDLSGTRSPGAATAAPPGGGPAAAAAPSPGIATAATGTAGMAAQPPSGFGERRPFVVIRFDRPDMAYEDALGVAVKRALARQSDVSFDVAAVAANDGTAAGLAANTEASNRHLAAVVRSLIGDGVPIERIILSATSVAGLASNEIRIYVH